MTTVVAFALLYVVGFPVGFVVTGRLTTGLLVAPLVTALIAAIAGVAVAAIGGSLSWWFVVLGVASFVASWAAIGRPRSLRGILASRGRARLAGLDGGDVLVLVVPLAVLSLQALAPPIEWDARSIWWFHASWFWGGGSTVQPALGNPAYAFSHPDYPPLVPATIAAAWHASRSTSLQLALQVSTLLTMTALATLGFVVRSLVPTASAWWARLAGLAVALSAWMLASGGPTGGLVDHVWPACLTAAAVLLLLRRDPVGQRGERVPAGFVLAILLATAAALTKNEGLVCAGVLAVVVTIRARSHLRRAALVWIPVVAGLAWSFVARRRGAVSDLANSPTVGHLLSGDLSALDRIPPSLVAMRGILGWYTLASALVTVLGVVVLRHRRRDAGLASPLWIWTVAALYTAALVVTYVVSPYDIAWHVASSVERVMVVVAMLLTAINASWFLVAVARRRTGRGPEVVDLDAVAGSPRRLDAADRDQRVEA